MISELGETGSPITLALIGSGTGQWAGYSTSSSVFTLACLVTDPGVVMGLNMLDCNIQAPLGTSGVGPMRGTSQRPESRRERKSGCFCRPFSGMAAALARAEFLCLSLRPLWSKFSVRVPGCAWL